MADIIIKENPHTGLKCHTSMALENTAHQSLCRRCIQKDFQYANCEIASLLFSLAENTGVATLMQSCPHFGFSKS